AVSVKPGPANACASESSASVSGDGTAWPGGATSQRATTWGWRVRCWGWALGWGTDQPVTSSPHSTPNHPVEPTANSVRYAPAVGGGSPGALDVSMRNKPMTTKKTQDKPKLQKDSHASELDSLFYAVRNRSFGQSTCFLCGCRLGTKI